MYSIRTIESEFFSIRTIESEFVLQYVRGVYCEIDVEYLIGLGHFQFRDFCDIVTKHNGTIQNRNVYPSMICTFINLEDGIRCAEELNSIVIINKLTR
jgi:hypothetical protein